MTIIISRSGCTRKYMRITRRTLNSAEKPFVNFDLGSAKYLSFRFAVTLRGTFRAERRELETAGERIANVTLQRHIIARLFFIISLRGSPTCSYRRSVSAVRRSFSFQFLIFPKFLTLCRTSRRETGSAT